MTSRRWTTAHPFDWPSSAAAAAAGSTRRHQSPSASARSANAMRPRPRSVVRSAPNPACSTSTNRPPPLNPPRDRVPGDGHPVEFSERPPAWEGCSRSRGPTGYRMTNSAAGTDTSRNCCGSPSISTPNATTPGWAGSPSGAGPPWSPRRPSPTCGPRWRCSRTAERFSSTRPPRSSWCARSCSTTRSGASPTSSSTRPAPQHRSSRRSWPPCCSTSWRASTSTAPRTPRSGPASTRRCWPPRST